MPITLKEHLKNMFKLIKTITEMREPSISDLVKATNLNRSHVYTLLGVLEELGLVERQKVRGLPPKTIVVLTDKGKKLYLCLKDGSLIEDL